MQLKQIPGQNLQNAERPAQLLDFTPRLCLSSIFWCFMFPSSQWMDKFSGLDQKHLKWSWKVEESRQKCVLVPICMGPAGDKKEVISDGTVGVAKPNLMQIGCWGRRGEMAMKRKRERQMRWN